MKKYNLGKKRDRGKIKMFQKRERGKVFPLLTRASLSKVEGIFRGFTYEFKLLFYVRMWKLKGRYFTLLFRTNKN